MFKITSAAIGPVWIAVCLRSIFPVILLAWNSAVPGDESAAKDVDSRVTFYAMGDVPYVAAEDVMLPQQIAELPQDAEFVVHVGDIKGEGSPCNEAVYMKVANMLSRTVPPVFIIPGDNEWNDCVDPDPVQAWTYWRKHLRHHLLL